MISNFINNFKANNDLKYILIFILFILLTNNYFNVNEINNSAKSSYYYLEISKSFPEVADFENTSQSLIHAERFFIPYMVGFLSKTSNLDIFFLYRLTTYLGLLILLIVNYKILNVINPINSKLIMLSLVLFNPYIFRYFIANPIMLNDLFFFISLSILSYSVFKEKNLLFYLSIILALVSRQSAYIIIFAIFITVLFPGKKNFVNFNKFLICIFLLMLNILITKIYIQNTNLTGNYQIAFMGIFSFFKNDFDIYKFITFLLYPLLSYLPLIIYIIYNYFYKNIKISGDKKIIFLSMLILGFFCQPILAGPDVAGKNIIRLSSYGYFILIYILAHNMINHEFNNKLIRYIFIFSLMVWSLHPTFSKINIF